jgi:hypothetical protein
LRYARRILIVKCRRTFPGVLVATSLLLPLCATAESQLQVGPRSGKVSATAHVDFRIVIPQVLSLGLMGGDAQGTGAQRVAIFSNSRNVTLAASGGSATAARNRVILRAAARKAIARDAVCQLPTDVAGEDRSPPQAMICTVSMP